MNPQQKEESVHLMVCNYLRLQYPNVMFNTDLSGIKLTLGQAAKVKKLRSSKGWPDLFISEPRGEYHGLFIELKREGERIFKKDGVPATDHIAEQIDLCEKLNKRGYYATILIGFDQAKSLIDWYLKL